MVKWTVGGRVEGKRSQTEPNGNWMAAHWCALNDARNLIWIRSDFSKWPLHLLSSVTIFALNATHMCVVLCEMAPMAGRGWRHCRPLSIPCSSGGATDAIIQIQFHFHPSIQSIPKINPSPVADRCTLQVGCDNQTLTCQISKMRSQMGSSAIQAAKTG